MDRFTVDDILCYQTQLSGCKELIKYSDHLEAIKELQEKYQAQLDNIAGYINGSQRKEVVKELLAGIHKFTE